MKFRVTYVGNLAQVAEYILFSPDFELFQIMCEQGRVNEDLITFSLVRGIPIVLLTSKNDLCRAISNSYCDFFIMFSFGMIIPKAITDLFEIYNIHSGYLPNYKGRHPTYWATVNSEQHIGITLHRVDAEIDTGEIIDRATIPYYFWMTEIDLEQALIGKIPQLLKSLTEYKLGRQTPICNSGGQYYKPVAESDKVISESDSYAVIFNKIRSQSKYRGAVFRINNTTSIWIRNVRFIYKAGDENQRFFIKDKYLHLHIRENVWLKTDQFEIAEGNIV